MPWASSGFACILVQRRNSNSIVATAEMKNICSIEDLRKLAQRKVPRAIFDYAAAGSYSQQTLHANIADLARINLRQRVMIDVAARDESTTMLGEPVSLPLGLAPVGMTGLQHANGEILACRAAHNAGIPFTLSTLSICSIEDVAAVVAKPFWFQLYVMKDRGFARSLMERAFAAKCSALMLTVDLQVLGQRHADVRNGLSVPPSLKLHNLLNMMTKPRWALGVLAARRWSFGNLAGRIKGVQGVSSLAQWIKTQFDETLNWKDVEWIRSIWPGKLIIKGILDVEDARIVSRLGASALVVSNHGGRQLDGARSSISMLAAIADAVGSDIEVMFDGGIRSGQDVMRALALGARSCLIGRPYIYGLGAGGEAGVARAIDIIRSELNVTMALTGVTRIDQIGRHNLVP
jgi:L-lactate dehydrogenase (cytochrome)